MINEKGLIRLSAETPDAMYFEVRNENGDVFNVKLFYEKRNGKNAILRWSCDCEYMSVQGVVNGAVCTHVMSAFYRKALEKLVQKDGRNQGEGSRGEKVPETNKVS